MSEAVRMPFWDRKALGLHAQIVADCAEDNDMVSLIASFKEMADLLGYKLTPRTELNAPPAVTEKPGFDNRSTDYPDYVENYR